MASDSEDAEAEAATDAEAEEEEAEEEEAEEEEAEEEEEEEEEEQGQDDAEPVPVGVKLGSTRTVVGLPGGKVAQSLTCIATYDDPLTGEERILYGNEAATEYPDRVQFMLRSGLPEDAERAALTERFFAEFIDAHDVPANSVVVYAVPTIDNEDGIENLQSVIENSAVGEAMVRSYPESLAASLPAFEDPLEALESIFVAVNMGSTNLELCAYRRGEQLAPYATGAVTGNEVDRRIAAYVEEETQGRVNIDLTTAREYKEDHADFDDFEPFTDVIQQPGGGSHEFTIERSVMDAVDEYLDNVVEEVADSFLPELASDNMKVYQLALDRPIVLTGGMACIPGIVEQFEERLSDRLQREVTAVAPGDAAAAGATGAQRIAERFVELEAY